MQVGEAQIKVEEGSPNIGPMRIEIGQELVGEGPVPKYAPREQLIVVEGPDYSEQLNQIVRQMNLTLTLLKEIRDLSVPWYVKLSRWIRGKLKWRG